MPTVRKLNRQVDTLALPGVRAQSAETAASRGAGLEQAKAEKFDTIARVGDLGTRVGIKALTQIQENARQHADQVAQLAWTNQVNNWELDRIHDPEHGALNVQGKESFELPEKVDEDYRTFTDSIEAGLATDRQRLAFARFKQERGANIALNVRRHVAGEMRTYELGELKATVETSAQLAIANAMDPRRVGVELSRGVTEIEKSAPRLGLGPAQVQAQVDAYRSGVHIGVINNLLANEQEKAASIYFAEAKTQIAGDKLDEVQKAIGAGTTKREVKTQAESIIAGGGTLTEQREKARAIEDPDVSRGVMELVEHESIVREKLDREKDEAAGKQATTIIDRTGDWRAIPTSMWNDFSVGMRASLKSYAKQKAEGVEVKTQMSTLYDLITMSEANPDQFYRVNLAGYADRLSPGDLEQMMRAQAAGRKGDDKQQAGLLVNERNQRDIRNGALQSLGLIASDADLRKPENKELAARVERFDRALRESVVRHEAATKKPITDTEMQQLADTLIAPAGQRSKGYFGGSETTYVFETAQAQLQSAADIPRSQKQQVDDALRRRGLPVNDANRLRLFNQYIATDVRKDR